MSGATSRGMRCGQTGSESRGTTRSKNCRPSMFAFRTNFDRKYSTDSWRNKSFVMGRYFGKGVSEYFTTAPR